MKESILLHKLERLGLDGFFFAFGVEAVSELIDLFRDAPLERRNWTVIRDVVAHNVFPELFAIPNVDVVERLAAPTERLGLKVTCHLAAGNTSGTNDAVAHELYRVQDSEFHVFLALSTAAVGDNLEPWLAIRECKAGLACEEAMVTCVASFEFFQNVADFDKSFNSDGAGSDGTYGDWVDSGLVDAVVLVVDWWIDIWIE